MKHYFEIIEKATKEVIKRLDVTDRSERERNRIEMGANINLNAREYYTTITESETELPII